MHPANRRTTIIAAALLLALPALVRANMAEPPEPAPIRPGDQMGEPAGGLRSVFVEHERLRIDLRPLAKGKPAMVEATYRTRNDGPARSLRLLFVADGLGGAGEVWLDGRPVANRRGEPGPLPASWRAPATTPGLDGEDLGYEAKHAGALAFQLDLPPGRHEIRVRYPAEAAAYQTPELMPVWQLGYVLAPAREWGGFGRLDVRVEVPRGWEAAASPALRREGGALVGSWTGVPADALALSARAPAPSVGWRYWLWLALCAAALWLCVRAGRAMGHSLGQRGRGALMALPLSFFLAIGWTVFAMMTVLLIPSWIEWAAGPLANRYVTNRISYTTGVLLLIVIPIFPVVGTVAAQIGAVLGRRSAAAHESRPAPREEAVAP
jgi:hypothetical protein